MAKASRPRGWRWEAVVPLLLAGAGTWWLVEEFRHSSQSVRTTATVTAWSSRRWFGFSGFAEAKVAFRGEEVVRKLRTILWYRPSPGEQVPVVVDAVTGEYVRIDNFWQRFAVPTGMVASSLCWLLGIWMLGRGSAQDAGSATPDSAGRGGGPG